MAVITNTIRWADNTAQLRQNLMQGIGTLDAMKSSVDRTVASLSGQGLFTAANKVAAAIQEMGGVTKLTAAEQERANGIIDKAIEKYKTMGMVVPPALQQISDATKKSTDSWEGFVKGFKVEDAITNPMGVAKQAAFGLTESIGGVALAAAAAVTSIVAIGGAVFSLAQKAAAVGGELDDMADKTGMSVPALSRLQNAAAVAGTSLGQLTDAVFKVEQKMGEGGEKWDEALKKMGLSTEALKAAGPDKYLELIASGLATIEDPAERAAAGVAVMGKSFKDMAAVLADLPAAFALTNDITPWTAEQAADAEKFEQQIESLKIHVEALSIALGRDLIPPVAAFVGVAVDAGTWIGKLVGQMSGITPMVNRIAEAWGWAAAAIDVFRGKTNLPIKLDGAEEAAQKLTDLRDKATDAALAPDKLVEKWKAGAAGMVPAIKSVDDAFRDQSLAGNDLKRTHEELAKANAQAEAAAKKHKEELTKVTAEVHKLQGGLFLIPESLSKIGRSFDESKLGPIAAAIGKVEQNAHIANFGFAGMVDSLKNVGQAGEDTGKELEKLNRFIGPIQQFEIKKTISAWDSLDRVLTNISGKFVEVAAVGLRAASEISKITENADKSGEKLSKGDWFSIAAIGISAVATAIGKLFGNNEEKKINPVREAFVQMHGGLAKLNEEANKAGTNLWALLQAKNAEQYQKAIDDLNAHFKALQDAIDDANNDLSGLLSDAVTMGGILPGTFDAAIQKLKDMGRITSDNASLFSQLTGATSVNFKTMEDIAKKYGMDLAKLGPSFQSAKLSDTAKAVINDFDTLVRGGGAVDDVLAGLRKPINDIVNDSIKFKVAIPENMRPWVEQLMRTHQLIDENGDEITDLGKIKFADPIKTEFQKLIDKISELIDKLTGPLTSAITGLPPVKIQIEDPTLPREREYAATGGRVTRSGLIPVPQYFAFGGNVLPWRPRGTDTVPAMLTPGELVLTPPAALAYEQVMAGSGGGITTGQGSLSRSAEAPSIASGGGLGGDLSITMMLDDLVVGKAVVKNFRTNKGGLRSDALAALGSPVTTWSAT